MRHTGKTVSGNMKTLKSSSKKILATVYGKTVYMSDLDGNIYKQFASVNFKNEDFNEEIEFPKDFNKAVDDFNIRMDKRLEEKRNRLAEELREQYEERKRRVKLLRKIRNEVYEKGSCKIYTVAIENYPINETCWEPIFISLGIFTDLESAEKHYKEEYLKGEPEEGYDMCFYLSEKTIGEDVLDVTEYNELEKLIREFYDIYNGNIKEEEKKYDYESLDGDILIEWSWERYIGYARNFIALRYGREDETEADIFDGSDSVYHPYTTILLKYNDIKGLTGDEIEERIIEELCDDDWRWTSNAIYNINETLCVNLMKEIEKRRTH